MKILSIGDIHGETKWKEYTHGSVKAFYNWLIDDIDEQYPFNEYDKIIFVGDYVDSFNVSNVDMIDNLKHLIEFKKRNPDKVVLLYGNHDLPYIFNYLNCPGHRHEIRYDIQKIFNDNKNLFTYAYQINNFLWTHAGITEDFLNLLNGILNNKEDRFYDLIQQRKIKNIADKLNIAFYYEFKELFWWGQNDGGIDPMNSPIWVRPVELCKNYIDGVNQIVGHTNTKYLTNDENDGVLKFHINDNTDHYFIDCLFRDVLIMDI